MIDLHSHILPGIDDGAKTMDIALEMARMAVDDGVKIMACTPHVMPPLYANSAQTIAAAVAELKAKLAEADIPLRLVIGADVHIAPDLVESLKRGTIPTLHGTRYFLLEPPHNIAPPRLDAFCATLAENGFLPVLTHPERFAWIENHYERICALDEMGVAIQVTAGAITGHFGSRVQYWAERLLDEGRVDIVASDGHDPKRRTPILSAARERIVATSGKEAAIRLLRENPLRVLKNDTLASKTRKKAAAKKREPLRIMGWGFGGRDRTSA